VKIDNLKELSKLMTLCRKQGVAAIEIDNIKFNLGPEPAPTKWVEAQIPTYTPGGITADTKIVTDELTPEQLLMWSTGGNPELS
jgi:hypothetical protein